MRIPALFLALFLSVAVHANGVTLKDSAPDRYTVVKGDTLWDISARFLKDAWRWPEIWQLNREQIHNPHLIYPGNVVRLVRGERPYLVLERGVPTVKLSPQVRAEPIVIEDKGIPSISYQAIAPFLNRGGISAPEGLGDAPYILGGHSDRVMYGSHDQVYATEGWGDTRHWQVVRQGRILKDPDSGETLGHELIHLGDAHVVRPGSPQLVEIADANQEILERDRLVPLVEAADFNYVPHAPEGELSGRVMANLGGVEGVGTYGSVILNRGHRDGLEIGHVLGVFKTGRILSDPKCQRAEKLAFMGGGRDVVADCKPGEGATIQLPERRVGLVFVYRVFERAAYALVLAGEEPIYVRDLVKNP